MGAPKQKWTSEEEEALKAGIEKHGAGKWKTIQMDVEFHHILASRSNIDLKDKWRNMSVSASGQGSREKMKVPKMKALTAPPPVAWTPPNPVPSAPVVQDTPMDALMESPNTDKNATKYCTKILILEAITNLKDPNGSDINAIKSYIQQRYEVNDSFKRILSTKLRRLLGSNLEKNGNCYRILKESNFGTRTPTPKQKENVRPKPTQDPGITYSAEALKKAVESAAYKIADAENKSFLASEAVKEAERISFLSLKADHLLRRFEDINDELSVSGREGETVKMPPCHQMEAQKG